MSKGDFDVGLGFKVGPRLCTCQGKRSQTKRRGRKMRNLRSGVEELLIQELSSLVRLGRRLHKNCSWLRTEEKKHGKEVDV